jgi:hypothetical protein
LIEERNEDESRRNKRTKTSIFLVMDFLTYMLEDESQNLKEVMSTPKAPIGERLSIVKLNPTYKTICGN